MSWIASFDVFVASVVITVDISIYWGQDPMCVRVCVCPGPVMNMPCSCLKREIETRRYDWIFACSLENKDQPLTPPPP